MSVPDLGTFALLAGPTVAPDGTVFLGTLEGKVIALHPDGSAYWNRQLATGKIRSSPAVGSDGSVYVVGSAVFRDHRGGEDRIRGEGTLYRFTQGGGAPPSGITDFPQYDRVPTVHAGPQAIGAPNVWQFGSDEVIMVPALYYTVGGADLHLFAFSPDGGIMADWSLYQSGGDVTGIAEKPPWFPPIEFTHGVYRTWPPFPGVAIAASPQGGTPAVVLVDRYYRQTIRFMFCVGNSCAPFPPGFTELFRTPHEPRELWSAPMMAPDLETVVGTDDGVVFNGPGAAPRPPVTGLGTIYAIPTRAANGDLVLVNDGGDVSVLRDGALVFRVPLSGNTMARAAASRSHVFVSTTEALYTLDANATASVFQIPLGRRWNLVACHRPRRPRLRNGFECSVRVSATADAR